MCVQRKKTEASSMILRGDIQILVSTLFYLFWLYCTYRADCKSQQKNHFKFIFLKTVLMDCILRGKKWANMFWRVEVSGTSHNCVDTIDTEEGKAGGGMSVKGGRGGEESGSWAGRGRKGEDGKRILNLGTHLSSKKDRRKTRGGRKG
jgi:hypothetical protein